MPYSSLVTCSGSLAELISLYPIQCSGETYFELLTGPLDCLCIATLGPWPEKASVFLFFKLRSVVHIPSLVKCFWVGVGGWFWGWGVHFCYGIFWWVGFGLYGVLVCCLFFLKFGWWFFFCI